MLEEMTYPNNIAMIRRMRGLSQAYVAKEIGVSRPKYIEIEKGRKELTVSQVEKLKQLLSVDFDDLIGVDTGKIDFRKFIKEETEKQRSTAKTPLATQANSAPSSEPASSSAKKPNSPKLFEGQPIRSVWDEKEKKWWFAVVDVIKILTDAKDPKDYIKKMKKRDPELNKGWGQIVPPLLVNTVGGKQRVGCADTKGVLRIIQSIPSKKAEPFKRWLAKVGSERIKEIENPELAMKRMREIYKQKGYPNAWIEQRERGIATRQRLTSEWDKRGASRRQDYAILTNEIYEAGFGLKAEEYKDFKGLTRKQKLRDSMTNMELALTNLGEATAAELHQKNDSYGIHELKLDAKNAGRVTKTAREEAEKMLDAPIVTNKNYLDISRGDYEASENLIEGVVGEE